MKDTHTKKHKVIAAIIIVGGAAGLGTAGYFIYQKIQKDAVAKKAAEDAAALAKKNGNTILPNNNTAGLFPLSVTSGYYNINQIPLVKNVQAACDILNNQNGRTDLRLLTSAYGIDGMWGDATTAAVKAAFNGVTSISEAMYNSTILPVLNGQSIIPLPTPNNTTTQTVIGMLKSAYLVNGVTIDPVNKKIQISAGGTSYTYAPSSVFYVESLATGIYNAIISFGALSTDDTSRLAQLCFTDDTSFKAIASYYSQNYYSYNQKTLAQNIDNLWSLDGVLKKTLKARFANLNIS